MASGHVDWRRSVAFGGERAVKKKNGNACEPVRLFKTQVEWALWLEKNHRQSKGLWLRLAKKGSGLRSVSYSEALEVALCYGWIDGQKRGEGDEAWLQRFLPRTAKSIWSRINQRKGRRADGRRAHETRRTRGSRRPPRSMGVGMLPTTCRKRRWSRWSFKLRWMRVRELADSLPFSTARIGTQSYFAFKRRRSRRRGREKYTNSSKCWSEEKQFTLRGKLASPLNKWKP